MQNAKCKTQNRDMGDAKTFDLGIRTKEFALRVIKLYQALPETGAAQILGKQILRSGTSVGAQYREARRARSKAEFQSKIGGALQELDETGYWLELLGESGLVPPQKLVSLHAEQRELTAILVSSATTAGLSQ